LTAAEFENNESRGDCSIAAAFVSQTDCKLRIAEDGDYAFQIWTWVAPCPEPPAFHELACANSSSRYDNSLELLELG
jgi:hypothetical protein